MRSYGVVFVVIVSLLALSRPAAAEPRKIFLNGVELTGVEIRNQSFEKATVRFDASGDLHITAPGFEIEKRPVARSPAAPAKKAAEPPPRTATLAGGRFYVVARPAPGKVPSPYRIAVYLNRKLVDVFEPTGAPVVVDVTDRVKAGKNRIRFVARPVEPGQGEQRSYSPRDRVEIVVGRGSVEKGTVLIRVPLLEYSRNASETRGFDNTYSVELK